MSSSTNVLFLCRLCGTETLPQYRLNIFDNTGIELHIKSKIINCLGFDVSENDYLPKVLCTECVLNLNNFNEFKIKSNKTALYLIKLLTQQLSVDDQPVKPQKPVNKLHQIAYNLKSISSEPKLQTTSNTLGLSSNPNFFLQLSQVQLPNVHKPPKQASVQNTSTKKMVYQCNVCKVVFQSHAESIIHVNSAHKSSKNMNPSIANKSKKQIFKEYKCDDCPKVCTSKIEMRRHILTHAVKIKRQFNCTICNKKSKTLLSYNSHMKNVHYKKKNDYVCDYCGQCLKSKESCDIHIRSKHTKEYPYHCSQCDKKFSSNSGLKSHTQSIHTDEYKYTCNVCHKPFKTSSSMNGHKKIHMPIESRQNFICNICNASYTSKRGLTGHILGHTGELNYGCTLCKNRYKNRHGLKVHMLTHTGEKNHVCDICGKAFALYSNLVNHRRIHTGERPFKCNICHKSFNQRSALSTHCKKSCKGEKQ